MLHRQVLVFMINSSGSSLVLMRPRPRPWALSPQEPWELMAPQPRCPLYPCPSWGLGERGQCLTLLCTPPHTHASCLSQCLCCKHPEFCNLTISSVTLSPGHITLPERTLPASEMHRLLCWAFQWIWVALTIGFHRQM